MFIHFKFKFKEFYTFWFWFVFFLSVVGKKEHSTLTVFTLIKTLAKIKYKIVSGNRIRYETTKKEKEENKNILFIHKQDSVIMR